MNTPPLISPDQSASSGIKSGNNTATGHSPIAITLPDAPIHFGEYAMLFAPLLEGAECGLKELILAAPSKSDMDQQTFENLMLALEIAKNVRERLHPDAPEITLLEQMQSSHE